VKAVANSEKLVTLRINFADHVLHAAVIFAVPTTSPIPFVHSRMGEKWIDTATMDLLNHRWFLLYSTQIMHRDEDSNGLSEKV
jgi:hypothetical protein